MTIPDRPVCRPIVALIALAAFLKAAQGHADEEASTGAASLPRDAAGDSRRSVPIASPTLSGPSFANGDPPVDVVCKAAVAMALADPERARGFVSRARLAGWLPEVSFRVYRRFARTEGLSFDDAAAGTVAPVDVSAIDDVRYEWRATWDLSRMVFNPDELQAHTEALRMSDVRRDIQSLVIRLYFERRRLVLEGRSTAGPAGETLAAERRLIRIAEIEAQLDAFSNGAFSLGTAAQREAAPAP